MDIYNNCIFNESIDGVPVMIISGVPLLNVTVFLKLDIIFVILSSVNKSDRVNSCERQSDLPSSFIIIGPFLNKLLIVSVNVLLVVSDCILVLLFL